MSVDGPDANTHQLNDSGVDVLNTLIESVLDIPFNAVPEGINPEPEALLLIRAGFEKVKPIEGVGEISLRIRFFNCELTLKVPNHKNNVVLMDEFTKRLLIDASLPFSKYTGTCDNCNVTGVLE